MFLGFDWFHYLILLTLIKKHIKMHKLKAAATVINDDMHEQFIQTVSRYMKFSSLTICSTTKSGNHPVGMVRRK
jgi:hypothetical protein